MTGFIAAKVRNGPRFAEIDAPVEHVSGAAELPEPPGKAKRAVRSVITAPLPDYPPITEVGFSSSDPRGRLAAWTIEREAIRQRKEAGQAWPWTDEPILAVGRFCNVYREHDRVTRWITANIVEPHRDDPDLWFALTLARCINEPDALAELLPFLLLFDAKACRETLQARQARGAKIIRTDGYKPPTPPTKSASTAVFVIDDVLAPMWRERETLRPQPGESLGAYGDRLEQCYRIGPFLAAQVIADLKPVAPLDTAADWWTFARPGPGSERGLNRTRGRPVKASWSEAHWHRELTALHAEIAPPLAAAGLAPLDAQNLQNCLCEFDKWERARDNNGKPARRYQLAEPAAKPKRELKPRDRTATQPGQDAAEAKPIDRSIDGSIDAPKPRPAANAEDIPAHIVADASQRAAARSPLADVAAPANQTSAPPGSDTSNDQRRHSSAGDSPHGSSGAARSGNGSKSAAAHDSYAEDHADEPFADRYLLQRGYQFVRAFDYTLSDGALLYEQRRYELRADIPALKKRPRKRFLVRRQTNGAWVFGAGPRQVPFNWPAVMRAGPGSTIFVTEGESNALALIARGLLATTVLSHKWAPECIAALTGYHAIILADHDKDGEKLAADAQRKLAPVAASTRIVAAPHLWKHLPGQQEPKPGGDVEDWIALGGDLTTLLDVCREIPADGAINFTDTPLTTQQWLTRDLAEADLLLGHVLSTSTRMLLFADTGLGKTHFTMAVSGHTGVGKDFLHWHCPRPARILYIDGEMSLKLFRERIADVARRLGGPPPGAYFFNKADMPGFAPLNTRDGQVAVWALIEEVERRSGQKLDAVCFDSIMALLLGDMKEEDAWRDTMPLVHALTARRIGQLWVHHTGHDTSHGYGTKTREWQMDTVARLEAIENTPPDIIAFRLSFPKARERTPTNRLDFTEASITLANDQWTGVLLSNARGKINESLTLKFYQALLAAADSSSVPRTGPYPTASLDEWRAQCTARGLLDPDKAHSARTLFARHKLKLIATNWIACGEELAWALP